MNHPRPWRMGAVAAAIALLGSLATLPAHALGLGRITVQSALGEPLRAEIDIADINAEEAASLRASVASAEAFKAAGLEFSPAMANVQISLQRRPDGRSFLRLSSDRPVSEPFVDLILEARWASGRVVRDYTMLFDPPNLRQASAAPMPAPTAPMVSRPAAPVAALPAAPVATPYSAPQQAKAPVAAIKPPAPRAAPAAKTPAADGQKVTVKAGDTAGKLAAQHKPANVSLDQMLVALLNSNPEAFVGGNINRLKAGAVLDVPGADQAGAVSAGEARQTIVAQSKDFNEFRRKLAEGAPATQVASADRQAAGKVQAKVEDKAPAAATPDKLTLSKGAVQGKAAAEEKIVQERQAKEAASRVAELSKNISDLNKLSGTPASPAVAAAPAPASPVTPGVTLVTPGALAVATPPPAPASSAAVTVPPAASAAVDPAPVVAAATPASAPTPVVAPVKKPVVVAPPPPPEPSLLDELMANPLLMAGGASLLVLLAALGLYRVRQRKNAVSVDSSFLESRLQPDSFFGASGGQRIDTNDAADANVTGSSMVYSPSQLDAAGDVDPVAEADVYLAYGRDLQAEEILKEAIRVSPTRVAIHAKLMEIYAKRRDTKAFETVAAEAFNLTQGHGVEWAHMAEMGRELDPSNPLYQPDGQPASTNAGIAAAASAATFSMSTQPQNLQPTPEPIPSALDFDLDLDFSLDDEPAAPTPVAHIEPTIAIPAVAHKSMGNGLDFSSATLTLPTAVIPTKPAPLDDGLDFSTEPTISTASSLPDTSGGMLEFDLGALSLDLDGPSTESQVVTVSSPSNPEDPLETKFALAEEFRAIGDTEGARSLAEEVLAHSSGSLKGKAQAFLNALS
ncbi:FimV/HubP family polar landmark protein [Polaromonas sp. SM01]|uniref:FimV/HubP family polar landmark protein n=1 Tax=Polaromonas sp. SM01 TaxID=3085630 RepID=UPI00298292A0|nr:FimV/HubP family polar landmark protein [Polaromonas sp. SM01]MDW5443718.1 FimV/HubP family polar landmark protein [Polaromonas sp. SM01]